MTSIKRPSGALLICLVLVGVFVMESARYLSGAGPGTLRCNSLRSNTTTTTPTSSRPTTNATQLSPLSLTPADLPGYTGWPRPAATLAHYFKVVSLPSERLVSHQNHTLQLQCRGNEACSKAQLFARAYGPAILPALVEYLGGGLYEVTIYPLDAGVYYWEVVLEFSQIYNMYRSPPPLAISYEGYLLPGFPLATQVGANAATRGDDPTKVCTTQDLSEASLTSHVYKGRWKVTHKAVHLPYDPNERTQILTHTNAIGFIADYFYNNCRLLTPTQVLSKNTLKEAMRKSSTVSDAAQLEFIFIGDSNTGRHAGPFSAFFGGTTVRHYQTHGGLMVVLPNLTQELLQLARDKPVDKRYVVFYNSGLHDLDHMCSFGEDKSRERLEYLNVTDDEAFSCLEAYRTLMRQFMDAVQSIPALLHVYQTTTAAWHKWGMYSVAWPPKQTQHFPRYPEGSVELNRIAIDLLQTHYPSTIIMDAYHLSYSRPDHRETNDQNKIGGKLVHLGPELYSVLTRQYAAMVLEAIASS